MSYIYFFLVALFGLSSCQSECSLDFVCDPSPESAIHSFQYHAESADICERSCKYVHDTGAAPPFPQCNFFTYRANTQPQALNCHYLTECRRLASPPPGMTSGVANCDDSTFFCDSLADEAPAYNDKTAYWTCDSGHPYGGTKVNQGVHCSVGCPSFKTEDGSVGQVSSECKFNEDSQKTEWSLADPTGVMTSDDVTIESPSENPLPRCGCGNLELEGEIADEEGKVFQCNIEPTVENGKTIITDENECLLLCDGVFVFDLFCSAGVWSIDLSDPPLASDIFCYNGGDGGNNAPLSTWFPPPKTDTPTDPPADTESPTETPTQ